MRRLVIVCAFLLCFVTLSFAIAPADNGTWVTTGSLLAARQGAAAVALPDGRVLVTGGRTSDGSVLATTEIIQADGTAIAGPAMTAPRAGHSATLLATGSVLIVGGDSGAGATVTAELFDPNTIVFTTLTATLSDARAGHVAALDTNGNVTIVGGTTANGPVMSVESFNVTTQQFVSIGRMMYSRSQAAIAAFKDGRVLIAGGVDPSGVTLASTEIFDPNVGASVAGPTMNSARAGATATLQIDGNIIVIGGSAPDAQGNATEIASGELFAADGTSSYIATVLNVARSGHTAFLLPENGGLLVVGGQAAGADLNTAELYQPWRGIATLSTMAATHVGGAGAAKPGVMAIAGGTNQTGIELFGFPTISTDQADYSPGTAVWMRGAGWLPQETVSLYMQAIPSTASVAPTITTIADGAGNISDGAWAPDTTDLGARFYLTAVGATSGWQAQTTFTDAQALQVNFAGAGSGSVNGGVSPTTTDYNCTDTAGTRSGTCSHNYNNNNQVTFHATASNSTIVSWAATNATLGGNCTATSTTCTVTMGNSAASVTLTMNANTSMSVQNVTGTYGGTTTLYASLSSASGSVNGQTVAFTVNGTSVGNSTTNTSGLATLPNVSLSGLNVGTYPVQATFATANGYNGSNGTGSLQVNGATTSLAVSPVSGGYGTTTTLSAALTSGGTAVVGQTVYFALNGTTLGSTTTNGSGVASLNGVVLDGIVGAGSYSTGVSAWFNGTSNYGSSNGTASLTISRATVTPSVTANNKTYDGNTSATLSSCTLSGVLSGDTANVHCAATAVNFADPYVSGSKTVTATGISLSGSAAGNYQLSTTSATTSAAIGQLQISASITATGRAYDTTTNITGASCQLSGVLAGDTGNVTCSATGAHLDTPYVAQNKPVTATVALNGAAAGNYVLAANYANTYVNITQAPVTPSITATDKNYDTTAFANVNCTLSGVFGADAGQVNCIPTYAAFSDQNVATNKQVTATVVLNGSLSSNYSLTSNTASTTATIHAVTVTAHISAQNKTYDGTANANVTNCSVSGVIGSDSVGCQVSSAFFDTPNAGVGKLVTANGITLVGTSAGNYQLNAPGAQGNANIDPAPVTATAGSYTGVYDGQPHAPSACQLSGPYLVGLSCTNNPASVTDAGSGQTTPVVTGSNSNFSVVPANGSYNVSQASSMVSIGCPASVTFNGAAQTPCTATVTGAGSLNTTVTPNYSNNTNAGTANVTASYAGDANHTPSGDSKTFAINPASSVVSLSCPTNVEYNGTAQTPCTATVTGIGLNASVTPSYSNNVDVGTATVTANFAGDPNHSGSSDSKTFDITLASSTVTLICPTSVAYSGNAQTPCTATVTGVGLNASITPGYSNNTNVGNASVTATFAGDANHAPSSDSKTFAITQASSTVTLNCPASVGYNGTAQTPCTASVTGVGLNASITPSYSNNTNAGTASVTAAFAGDANHSPSSNSATFTITKVTPGITWAAPAPIIYGTPLSSAQLNASAGTVLGTFAYTPAAGTVLQVGTQTLRVTFTPADGVNYNTATASVSLVVQSNVAMIPTITPGFGSFSSPTTVTITNNTDGASVYYTTDGSTPTANSTPYTGSFTITQTTTIRAIAIKAGLTPSPVNTVTLAFVGITPTITPGFGSFSVPTTVTITNNTSGASVYYTTDGSTPTANSTPYTGSFTITQTTTIRAVALKTGWSASPVNTVTLTFIVVTPTITPGFGTFSKPQTITMSESITGASIYYTLDGSTPTANSTPYTGAFSISKTTTIKAVAMKDGWQQSPVNSVTLTFK